MKSVLVAVLLLVLLPLVACDDDGSGAEATPTVTTAPTASSAAQIPQEIFDAVDAYILSGAIGSIIPGKGLELPDDCTEGGDVCLGLGPPTSVSEDEATVGIFINQSDASWEIALRKQDGQWAVTEARYTGCC